MTFAVFVRRLMLVAGSLLWVFPAQGSSLEDPPALASAAIRLLDARLALMPDVAAAKWIASQSISDPAREALVIKAAGEEASSMGLDRAAVEALFSDQIARARDAQSAAFEQWRAAGSGPTTAPSLRDDLRPKIDRITHELLRSLYLAAPILREADLEALAAGLPDARWNDAERHRLVELLTAVKLTGARSPQRLHSARILRIGLPADYAPFAWLRNGALHGADIALTQELAAQLDVTPVYIRSSWSTLSDDLAADRFDLAAGGISITAARRVTAGFSAPLTRGGKTALGRCEDRARFTTAESIDSQGVRVIENPGGTNEQYAKRHLKRASLIIHSDNLGVFNEIAEGRADVMYTDDIEIARLVRHDPRLCRLLPTIDDAADKALLLPKDAAWQTLVDPPLQSVLAHQSYQSLLDAAIAE
jgi:cyclohexadienyl dehydratase